MKTRAFFLLALIAGSLAGSLTVNLEIRDFLGLGDSEGPVSGHEDFESFLGSQKGMVQSTLGADGIPVPTGVGSTTAMKNFGNWFRDDASFNKKIFQTLTLNDNVNPGIFTFSDDSFFPIDNLGFGNRGNSHNFHFTMVLTIPFTFQTGLNFNFRGDDDVFAFIDGKLVIDLGGVHPPETAVLDLDVIGPQIGLTVGTKYEMKIFYAERHTVQSVLEFSTNFPIVPDPPKEDNGTQTAYICEVVLPTHCKGKKESECPFHEPSFSFGSKGSIPFSDFNAIALTGNIFANTGDIQGRAACADDFTAPDQGFSIGDQVVTVGAQKNSEPRPFSLVVGGDCKWGPSGGNLLPDGLGASPKEDAFVVGTVHALPPAVNHHSPASLGLNAANTGAQFTAGFQYYVTVNNELGALADTATAVLSQFGGDLLVTCNPTADQVVFSISPSDLAKVLSYSTTTCPADAQYIINIRSTGDVTINGGNSFFGKPERTVYNLVELPHPVGAPLTFHINNHELRGSILAPTFVLDQNGGVIKGLVYVARIARMLQINLVTCARPPSHEENPPTEDCPTFESEAECSLEFPLGTVMASFKDFNAVSFGDWIAASGDVEGRLALKGNLNVSAYSVGDKIDYATANILPYSLVVGGNGVFTSGAVFPTTEQIYVDGTFTASQDLLLRQDKINKLAALGASFDKGQQCYSDLSAKLAKKQSNTKVQFQFLGLFITCENPRASEYVVNIEGDLFSQATWYLLTDCNFGAKWVFNILGTGPVKFQGDNIPAISGGVVYNVIGNRQVSVITRVQGSILAPTSTVSQTGGVIVGKLVAGNVPISLQVNLPECPPSVKPIEVPTYTSGECKAPCKDVPVVGTCVGDEGDTLTYNGETSTIIGTENGKVFKLASPLNQNVPTNAKVVATINSVLSPRETRLPAPPVDSGAASLAASLFLLVVVLLF